MKTGVWLCVAILCAAQTGVPTALAQAPAADDSALYQLAAGSRFDVRTGKAGLLGFAGHEHLIRARRFRGTVTYYPGAPQRSRAEIHVETAALEVLTPPDTAEIRKVTEAMRTEVLHVDRYPEIMLVSRSVGAIQNGIHLVCDLTIGGQTRSVPVDVHTTFAGDTLRATASFSVNQTAFGITPYRGGPGGTVRVADRVTFDIAAVAIRERTR